MKNFHNIETKKINGYYIGYDATGRSWRITGKTGCWNAYASVTVQGLLNCLLGFDRLSEISAELSNMGNES